MLLVSNISGQIFGFDVHNFGRDPLMNITAESSTIDTICVTHKNAIVTAGRSLRGLSSL